MNLVLPGIATGGTASATSQSSFSGIKISCEAPRVREVKISGVPTAPMTAAVVEFSRNSRRDVGFWTGVFIREM